MAVGFTDRFFVRVQDCHSTICCPGMEFVHFFLSSSYILSSVSTFFLVKLINNSFVLINLINYSLVLINLINYSFVLIII